jgi:D-aminoacyl-tRNA deacylase
VRLVLQRVLAGSVSVAGETVGEIGEGLVILVGVGHQDREEQAERLAQKVAHLRIFEDEAGKFNRSLLDAGGAALVVSQFTLHADARKGRRPSFIGAAPPEHAEPLVEAFAHQLRRLGVRHVAEGRFGASMLVKILNHGPVTIWLDSDDL